MSWDLAEKMRERFPDVELFPRPGAAEPHEAPPPAAPATAVEGAPAEMPKPPETPKPAPRRPAHEAAPSFLTPGVFVPRERLLEVCRALADEFHLDYLSFVSAIDRPETGQFEVLYHLYSFQSKEELVLKVRVGRDAATAPSVTGIWDGANWHERETYDLFGIVFEGHPNLRRIMMTDDWVGYPLRKDYVYQDPPWLVEAARQRQKDIEGFGLGERA